MNYQKMIYQITTEAWKFFRRKLPVQNEEEYWDGVRDGYGEFIRKYEGTEYYRFAVEIGLSYLAELQRLKGIAEGGNDEV